MKYFLHIDTYTIYSVPKRFQYLLEIINSKEGTDANVNIAIDEIINKCKVKMVIDAMSQTL